MSSLIESPLTRLTLEQIEELGREFDAIHDDIFAELGERDRKYITSMIEMHRRMLLTKDHGHLRGSILLALKVPGGVKTTTRGISITTSKSRRR